MASTHTTAVPVPVGDDNVTAIVTYSYAPGRPAVMYLRNGDPGYPAESPEVEALAIYVGGHPAPKWFEEAASDHIHEWLIEHHEEPGPDPDAAREAKQDAI